MRSLNDNGGISRENVHLEGRYREEIHELPLLRPEEEFTRGRDPCVSKKKKKKYLKAVI